MSNYISVIENINTAWRAETSHKNRREACKHGARALSDNAVISSRTFSNFWFNELMNEGQTGNGFYVVSISKEQLSV